MALRIAVLIMLLVLGSGTAGAVQPDEILANPQLEQRARKLSRELRCMVCQNQSIDDSDATLARDLRLLVRERLTAGDTDEQVLTYLTDRYGDFVLLRPRFTTHNALLWVGPPVLLTIGCIAVFLAMRRRRYAEARPLTPDEQTRVDELMTRNDG